MLFMNNDNRVKMREGLGNAFKSGRAEYLVPTHASWVIYAQSETPVREGLVSQARDAC